MEKKLLVWAINVHVLMYALHCNSHRYDGQKASVHQTYVSNVVHLIRCTSKRFLYLFTFNWNNTCNRSISRLTACSLFAACNANRIIPKIELCTGWAGSSHMKRELFDLVHARSLRSAYTRSENKHRKRHDIEPVRVRHWRCRAQRNVWTGAW